MAPAGRQRRLQLVRAAELRESRLIRAEPSLDVKVGVTTLALPRHVREHNLSLGDRLYVLERRASRQRQRKAVSFQISLQTSRDRVNVSIRQYSSRFRFYR